MIVAGLMPLLVATAAPPLPPDPSVLEPAAGGFNDIAGSVFEEDIEWLADTGITRGCNPPDNTSFCPDDTVSRGQMAAFLRRALEDVLTADGGADFNDDSGSVFEEDIEWLAGTGITRGCNPPDNTEFCPDETVTRGQMAAFLRRALEESLTATVGTDFTDDNGSVFEEDIEWLAGTGITRGCNPPDNTRFCPDETVTRGQMTAFLRRGLLQMLSAPPGDESLQDPSTGAGTSKDFSAAGGGTESDLGEPPSGGGYGIAAFDIPVPVTDDVPTAAGPAPRDWEADGASQAPPGPSVNPEEVTGDLVSLYPTVESADDSTDISMYCPDPNLPYWGFNCPSQPVYDYSSEWLLYENLPYHVGQLAPVGCTGTLVGRNVVLTAAHCVSDQESFVFVPDLYGGMGIGPYAGVGNAGNFWTGTRKVYHAEFLTDGAGFSMFDYAFVVLNANSNGQHAGDVYGWTSVFNLAAASTNLAPGYYDWDAERHMYGYPQEGWWAGLGTGPYANQNYDAVPWWCGTNDGQYYHFGGGYYTIGFGCQTNGGNSGGPIYQRTTANSRSCPFSRRADMWSTVNITELQAAAYEPDSERRTTC